MKAYVIIGNANTRKSSILRSLTGCFNRSNRDIQLLNDDCLQIYVRVSSLQESKTTPSEFIEETKDSGQSSVIFCLWLNAHTKDPDRYPDANAYISFFQNAGWKFQSSAILAPTQHQIYTPNTKYFDNSAY